MSESVWDQIESDPVKAELLKARSILLMHIADQIKSWNVTQKQAGKRLGITRKQINDIMRGKFNKFSLEMLYRLAIMAGFKVKVEMKVAVIRSL